MSAQSSRCFLRKFAGTKRGRRYTGRGIGASFLLLVAVAALGAAPYPVAAAPKPSVDPGRAQEFVREGLTEAIEIFRSKGLTRAQVAEKLRHSLRTRFDMPTIAGFALGVHRRRVSRAEYKDYVQAFEEMLVESLTSRIFSLGPQLVADSSKLLKVTDAIPVGRRDLLVRSQVDRVDAERMSIDWRLRARNGTPKIVDVVILGVSQAQLYRQEFHSVIQRRGKGLAGLIEALKDKNRQLRSR